MLKEYWGNIPDTPEARDWVRNVMDKGLWTSKEVQELYGLSQSTLSRLYTKHDWQFAFKKGNQILFLAEYAKPWFDQFNSQQNVNLSAERVGSKGSKRKPGRPKKADEGQDWRDTWLGDWHIVIGEEFASPKAYVNDLSRKMSIHFKQGIGTPEHQQWLETRKALKQHFNIQERSL